MAAKSKKAIITTLLVLIIGGVLPLMLFKSKVAKKPIVKEPDTVVTETAKEKKNAPVKYAEQTGPMKTFGGELDDVGYDIRQTTYGDYMLVGWTKSFGNGNADVFLVKLGADLKEKWRKFFGGKEDENAYSIQLTRDGGFIIGGDTSSFGSGKNDLYLIKLDSAGNEQWSKAFGGDDVEYCNAAIQTADGGYILAGESSTGGAGMVDAILLKTDADGKELWTKMYGGHMYDSARKVVQTSDGGYVLLGATSSMGEGNYDVYLLKTDAAGKEEWAKTFGTKDTEGGMDIQQTRDGGFIITGWANRAKGMDAVYLLKTNADGKEEWSNLYGSMRDDVGNAVKQLDDGSFVIVGRSSAAKGAGFKDVLIMKVDAQGKELWSKMHGDKKNDEGNAFIVDQDGGFVIVGTTESIGSGKKDMLLIKTDAEGNIVE